MPKRKQEEIIKKLLETLEKGVEEFKYTPEQYAAILKMQALMPHYTFRNIMLAKAQLPHASFIAGFKRWKELGRYVRKGERALRILAPRIVKKENDKGDEEDTIIGFISIPVFDASQTEGDPLPIDNITKIKLEGDCLEARKIIKVATIMAENDNCQVSYGNTGIAHGLYYIEEHAIKVADALSINHQAKTLVHELVHSRVDCKNSREKSTAEEREVVAEGTAFVICHYFGLDTSDYSFQYVSGWGERMDNPILKYGEKISKTAGHLIKEFEMVSNDIAESVQIA